jgi:hypothetical protein
MNVRATAHELGTHIQRALGMQLHIHVAETLLESKSRTAIVCPLVVVEQEDGIAQQTLSTQIMRG